MMLLHAARTFYQLSTHHCFVKDPYFIFIRIVVKIDDTKPFKLLFNPDT